MDPFPSLWIQLSSRGPVSFPMFCPRSSAFRRPVCVQSPTCLFPLPLDLPCAAAAPEEGFPSCLSREEKCFSSSLFEAPHHSLEIHPLAAEADDKTNLTESRHRVLDVFTLRFFHSTSKISLKSKTDSSVWLTLNNS